MTATVNTDVDTVISDAESRTKEDIPRDRWSRPLVVPPGKPAGAKRVGYTRASTLGSALEDTFGLTAWKLRMCAIGVATRPELVLSVNAAAKGDIDSFSVKQKLNGFTEQAMEAAQASAKAHVGTALHAYAEQYDLGNDVGYIPTEYERDLQAYIDITTGLLEHIHIEQFCVCDELETGGTPDRMSRLLRDMYPPDGTTLPAGTLICVDQKTSQGMDFGGIKFSVQLAVYARSLMYDWQTAMRSPWVTGEVVNTSWGLIIHTPSGTGDAALYWVDLRQGWELAGLARTVREWRKNKTLVVPDGKRVATIYATKEESPDEVVPTTLALYTNEVRCTETLDDLRTLARQANGAGVWSMELREVFTARRLELERKRCT